MKERDIVSENLVNLNHLTQLSARQYFLEINNTAHRNF